MSKNIECFGNIKREILYYKIEYKGGQFTSVDVKYREGEVVVTNNFKIQDVAGIDGWIYKELRLKS